MPDQAADVTGAPSRSPWRNPRGPVYLSLPREPLSAMSPTTRIPSPRPAPTVGGPAPQSIEEAVADSIATARRPLIIAGAYGRTGDDVEPSRCARGGLRHSGHSVGQRFLALPSSHPLFAGSILVRSWPTPIWSSRSSPTCPGFPQASRRRRSAGDRDRRGSDLRALSDAQLPPRSSPLRPTQATTVMALHDVPQAAKRAGASPDGRALRRAKGPRIPAAPARGRRRARSRPSSSAARSARCSETTR